MTDDPSWAAYPSTILEFHHSDSLVVDLRHPIPDETRDRLASIALNTPFAVLTACNPRGQDSDAADNDRRSRALEET
jgi:hypothetical protein